MRLIDVDTIFNGDLLLVSDKTYDAVHAVIERINNAPTLDPVKHGHWVREQARDGVWCIGCTNCANGYDEDDPMMLEWLTKYFHYCPNCGAKMDETDRKSEEI